MADTLKQGFDFEFDKKEYAEFQRLIGSMVKNVGNLRPFFVYAVSVMSESTAENFRLQGSPPYKWRQLAESTIEAREKRKTWPGTVLEEYGTLKQSLSVGGRRNIKKQTATSVEFGTKMEKAAALQFGRPEINLPSRPYLYWKRTDVTNLMSWLSIWAYNPDVAKGFGGGGSRPRIPTNLFLGFG